MTLNEMLTWADDIEDTARQLLIREMEFISWRPPLVPERLARWLWNRFINPLDIEELKKRRRGNYELE